ncbi:MAG TPA: hypothetical protein VFW35_07415 [Sphingomicrobium sp.]|nr:hypothetical protein [Sphingomicrobium sp.]
MLNQRLQAAHRIANALIPAEADIDAALASTSRLAAAVAEGRRETRLPIAMCQESLVALAKASQALVEARAAIGAAHASLAEDRVNAGLKAYGMGDLGDCPPTTGELKLVDDEIRTAA